MSVADKMVVGTLSGGGASCGIGFIATSEDNSVVSEKDVYVRAINGAAERWGGCKFWLLSSSATNKGWTIEKSWDATAINTGDSNSSKKGTKLDNVFPDINYSDAIKEKCKEHPGELVSLRWDANTKSWQPENPDRTVFNDA